MLVSTLTFTSLDWTIVSCPLLAVLTTKRFKFFKELLLESVNYTVLTYAFFSFSLFFYLQSLASAIAATKVLSAQQVVKNEAGQEVRRSRNAQSFNLFFKKK